MEEFVMHDLLVLDCWLGKKSNHFSALEDCDEAFSKFLSVN